VCKNVNPILVKTQRPWCQDCVPDLLPSPVVLHPKERIFMHASKMLC
jgi:hypothetical protein